MRLDKHVFWESTNMSREKIHDLILSGNVLVNGVQCLKPAKNVEEFAKIEISNPLEYVSRAALKLKHGCEYFKVSPKNRVVLDIGASTGGFTDYCLKNGATHVYAIDVGTQQLDQTILKDKRVTSIEQMNIKDLLLSDISASISLVVADVSFISLTHVIDKICSIFPHKIEMILLIKPQFELSKEEISKTKGLVNTDKLRQKAIDKIVKYSKLHGYKNIDVTESPIKGKKMGNIEYIAYLK